ncbi:hypothetical protein MNBD_GAMMA05-2594 [hydrothermal vent metagenome]|uniref:Uncharacterized protein n=1 Tax=hydrothermal vent metagenome TaxID=652676 RepID=A0A3B0X213_9ZZZZ
MNLLAKLKLVKLNQNGLNTNYFNRPFNQQQANQNKAAYFCEHDGICIKYTQAGFNNARSSWHAITPCALKPWWLFLKPLHKK